MSAALVSLLTAGAGQSTLLRSGSEVTIVPAEAGCSVISGGRSATRTAFPGAGAGISGFGAMVPGAETRVPEASAKIILLSAECCHLVGELLHPLQKCGAVGDSTNDP
jgi:hypothetical protein